MNLIEDLDKDPSYKYLSKLNSLEKKSELEKSEDQIYSIYMNSKMNSRKNIEMDANQAEVQLANHLDLTSKRNTRLASNRKKQRAKSNYQNFMEKIEKVELNDIHQNLSKKSLM